MNQMNQLNQMNQIVLNLKKKLFLDFYGFLLVLLLLRFYEFIVDKM